MNATGDGSGSLGSKLGAAGSLAEVPELIGIAIAEKLSDIFMNPVTDIELGNQPAQCGIDSLVAVELRNMLVQQAASEVSIFGIMQSVTLAALAADAAVNSAYFDSSRFDL